LCGVISAADRKAKTLENKGYSHLRTLPIVWNVKKVPENKGIPHGGPSRITQNKGYLARASLSGR
jgi:hypothetical protein